MDWKMMQEDDGALWSAARRRSRRKQNTGAQRVSPYTFGHAPQVDSQEVSSLGSQQEAFASNLSRYLSAYLRSSVEISKASLDEPSYGDFLQRFSEPAYFASLMLQPPETMAVLTLDLTVVFPLIDLLLGGQGKVEPMTRDITEIEEGVLDAIGRVISRELQSAWQPLSGLRFQFNQRERHNQAIRLMKPAERILLLGFEIRLTEAKGALHLAFPSATAGRLLRKGSGDLPKPPAAPSAQHDEHLRKLLLEAVFPMEMRLTETSVRGLDLLTLEPGQTLVLQHRTRNPVPVRVAKRELFLAYPVRSGKARAAMIDSRLKISPPPKESR